MAEKFYDVPGAAQVLGLKHETMRRWLRSGKVRGLRLGRDWRISERALDELAHKATNQPTGSTPSAVSADAFGASDFNELEAMFDELNAEADTKGEVLTPHTLQDYSDTIERTYREREVAQ